MSLSSCLKIGAAAGVVGGLASSAYFTDTAERVKKIDNPGAFATELFSTCSFVSGPFVGVGVGLGYYGLNKSIKYIRAAPRSTQMFYLTTLSSVLAMTGAYTLAKASK